MTFGANADNVAVNGVMQSIAYSNSSNSAPASVQVDWIFNDGNFAAEQGSGGALTASGNTIVNILNTTDLSIAAPATATLNEDSIRIFNGANTITIDDEYPSDTPLLLSLSVDRER